MSWIDHDNEIEEFEMERMKMNVWLVWEHVRHEESTLLAVFSSYDKAADYAGTYEDTDRVFYRIEMMEMDKEEIKDDRYED